MNTPAHTVEKKILIVGQEIKLKGEITACDKLVVEGRVEVALSDGRQIEIGQSGVFTGKAEVAEADVSGHFEGELVARDRLTIRSTGRVTGKIRYGRIVIEAGGEITGEVESLGAAARRGNADPATAGTTPKSAAKKEGEALPSGSSRDLELMTAGD